MPNLRLHNFKCFCREIFKPNTKVNERLLSITMHGGKVWLVFGGFISKKVENGR